MNEDKQLICNLLIPALRETRDLRELASLTYDDDAEIVTAKFYSGGIKIINVAMDSGTALIKDIVTNL